MKNLNFKIPQNAVFTLPPNLDISETENILLDEQGYLRSVPYKAIAHIPREIISTFCVKYGIYQIITDELVEFVREEIGEMNAIEIGAGQGCLGRALGIPITDSKMQERKEIKEFYARMQQPVIKYPNDVKKLDGLQAVKVFKAEAAVGAWVTHKYKYGYEDGNAWGVDEAILSKRLKRYIFIGNERTHANKELFKFCIPRTFRADWLVSRSLYKENNVIWVFDLEK